MKAWILAANVLMFGVSTAQAACSVDIVGSWSVTHTSERLGAARFKEEMPWEFSFSRDGTMDMQMGYMQTQSPYTCNGKTITVRKAVPWVLEIVSPGRREIAWKDQDGGQIFYLRRN
jgi:hypothetical protein